MWARTKPLVEGTEMPARFALEWQIPVINAVECPLVRSFHCVLPGFISIGLDHRSNIQVVVFYRIEHFVLV